MLIDSVPPAMTTSAQPTWIAAAASATVCRPEEQKRLTVRRNAHRQAGFAGDAGDVQPLFARHGAAQDHVVDRLAQATDSLHSPRITVAASSSGRTVARAPRFAFPTAVRTAATMTASRFIGHLIAFMDLSPSRRSAAGVRIG
jgi:hypothetical protein